MDLQVNLRGDASAFAAAMAEVGNAASAAADALSPVIFARPADIPAPLLALAESMWAEDMYAPGREIDLDTDELLATLLGLDLDDGHDPLERCEHENCGAWFWLDNGAIVSYESGRDLTMCDVHAVPDDPGARVWPGAGLEAVWRERDAFAMRERMRLTGTAW